MGTYLYMLGFALSRVALQGEELCLIPDTIAEVICLLCDKSGCCSRLASAGYESLRKSEFSSQVPGAFLSLLSPGGR